MSYDNQYHLQPLYPPPPPPPQELKILQTNTAQKLSHWYLVLTLLQKHCKICFTVTLVTQYVAIFLCLTTALVESLVLDLEQSEAIFHLQDFFPRILRRHHHWHRDCDLQPLWTLRPFIKKDQILTSQYIGMGGGSPGRYSHF